MNRTLSSPSSLSGLEGEWMDYQRYLEGCMAVVHSRAMAYPLQGWFERRQSTTLQHPTLKQGAGGPRPPCCVRGWVP